MHYKWHVKRQIPGMISMPIYRFTGHTTGRLKGRRVNGSRNHSSGAVWELRWLSWSVRPNEPSGFRGRKELLNHASALVTTCPWYVNWHLRTLSITSSSGSRSHAFLLLLLLFSSFLWTTWRPQSKEYHYHPHTIFFRYKNIQSQQAQAWFPQLLWSGPQVCNELPQNILYIYFLCQTVQSPLFWKAASASHLSFPLCRSQFAPPPLPPTPRYIPFVQLCMCECTCLRACLHACVHVWRARNLYNVMTI